MAKDERTKSMAAVVEELSKLIAKYEGRVFRLESNLYIEV